MENEKHVSVEDLKEKMKKDHDEMETMVDGCLTILVEVLKTAWLKILKE